MAVNHKFLGTPRIEISITLQSRSQRNHCGIDDFLNRKTVVQNCLHECAIVSEYRRVPGVEVVRLRPSQSPMNAEELAI
jgi:hypothetical protein